MDIGVYGVVHMSLIQSKMALSEVCGINSLINFNKKNENDEIENYKNISNFIDNTQLATPPFSNPSVHLAQLAKSIDNHGSKINIHFDHGTTTLAFKYQGGIIVAVDSRATGGMFIGSQNMKKIVEINDYMIGTIAGGAADCVYWDRVLSKQCRMFELRNRERISVAAASKLLSNMVYGYKGMGLSIGMMFAGYDKRGASLYYIDSDGTRTSGQLFSVGSGSLYAYGVLDSGYKWDLSDEDAMELGRRSIYHATNRDAASGGIVRVYHVKSTGWVDISKQDCKTLHYLYKDQKEQEDRNN